MLGVVAWLDHRVHVLVAVAYVFEAVVQAGHITPGSVGITDQAAERINEKTPVAHDHNYPKANDLTRFNPRPEILYRLE